MGIISTLYKPLPHGRGSLQHINSPPDLTTIYEESRSHTEYLLITSSDFISLEVYFSER